MNNASNTNLKRIWDDTISSHFLNRLKTSPRHCYLGCSRLGLQHLQFQGIWWCEILAGLWKQCHAHLQPNAWTQVPLFEQVLVFSCFSAKTLILNAISAWVSFPPGTSMDESIFLWWRNTPFLLHFCLKIPTNLSWSTINLIQLYHSRLNDI